MRKNIRKVTLILSLIILPIFCIIGVFSLNFNDKYVISSTVNDGVVSLVSGEFYGSKVSDENSAFEFLNTVSDEYGFTNSVDEFIFDKVVTASTGNVYKFKQVHKGLEVYGRGLNVSTDENGRVIAISGNYKKSNAEIKFVEKELFVSNLNEKTNIDEIYLISLIVYNNIENIDSVCYKINCTTDGKVVDMIIDANTYEIYQTVTSSSNITDLSGYSFVKDELVSQTDASGNLVEVKVETYQNNSGNVVHLLSDKSKKIYMTVMIDGKTINHSKFYEYYLLDSDLSADDPMVVEAYNNLIKCYDYYANAENFGVAINGLKNEAGKPINLIAVVHATDTANKSYDNAAYWILNSNSSYAYFLFGDGGSNAVDYASSLDVVGHEYQHGITTSICNLEYLNESGAINEAISDIFGAIIEGHDISEHDFWLMGEDITVSSVAFRDMSNPYNTGLSDRYPAHISEMYPLCTKKNCSHLNDDYGGVHYNSSILTYMTYKMYTYDTTFFTTYRIAELWYNTLTRLNTTSTFADFRIQMLSSATALGYEQAKIDLISRAFADVGLVSADAEFKINFFDNEADANNGTNLIDSITAIYGTKIKIPSAEKIPEGKLFYYWTDSQGNKYNPGSEIEIKYEDLNLWAYYIDAETTDWENLDIQLEGEGSTTTPYQIYSAVEWVYLSYLVNSDSTDTYKSKDYSLESDIYLNNIVYTPIGTMQYPFSGYLNGGNHTIYGLNLSKSGLVAAGVFGVSQGTICNLGVAIGETTSTASYTGAIAGVNSGYITNCFNRLSIISTGTVGGLTGISYSIGGNSIVNSYNEGNITGDIVGGITGDAAAKTVSGYDIIASSYIGNVYSTGDLFGNIVGGVIGRANGFYIVNSMVTGAISVSETASLKISGGVVGYLMNEPIDESIEGNTDSYSGIFSCKVISLIENDSQYSGMLIGKIFNTSTKGRVIIENNTIKRTSVTNEIGNLSLLSNEFKSCIILEASKVSDDGIYEGDFDFDNPDYFTNTDNWTITRSISLFNLESVWTIAENKQMPKILDYEFWINYAADSFSGGVGTAQDPFLIGSAEELALLSVVVGNSYYNSSYSTRYYKLTNDIDLTGKIWVGIGCSIYTYPVSGNISVEYLGFSGTFDGDNHTITGMNSISAYSTAKSNNPFIDYFAFNYDAGLFSLLENNVSTSYIPTIMNLNLRNVSVSGSYAGGLVAKSLCSAHISNVYVHSGNVNGSSVAGGVVGVISNNAQNVDVNICNSMNNARVSARVVGGLVGKVENTNGYYEVNTNIETCVSRGELLGFGDEVYEEPNYFMAYVGGLVGVTSGDSLVLTDNIYIGDIIMYTPGDVGGLVGATGHYYNSASAIKIETSYNKVAGDIIFKFENSNSHKGNYIGSVLNNTVANVEFVDNLSASNLNINLIGYEYETATKNISSIFVDNQINESGAFDFDNINYYSSSFSSESSWNLNNIKSMLVKISFIDHTGTIIDFVYLLYGSKLSEDLLPDETLTRETDGKYDYTFTGWEFDENKIYDQNSFVSATYDKQLKIYKITYKSSDGEVIKEIEAQYGDLISQDVKAPEKKGNLFVSYEFNKWNFESDTVTGDMVGYATYKIVLGENLLYLGLIIIVLYIIVSVVSNNIKKKKQKAN